MAQLEFCDKHNMVAYLVKSAISEGFDEILDFLTLSHIYYALTENPIIFVSLIEQFWENAVLSTTEEGLQANSATIDGHEKLITEDSLRRHLKSFLTPVEVLYPHNSTLSELQEDCMGSIQFIQLLLNKQQRLLLPHTRTYPTPTLTSKLFSNMRRASKGYSGVVTPLFESMLVQAHDEEQHQSPSRITSTPSLSQQPTPSSPLPEPIQPPIRLIRTVQDEGISWILQEEEVHEKPSDETEVLVQEETPTKIIEEHGSGEKGKMEISTANIQVSTASPPKVSIVVPYVYTRRSAKDKGKAIMEDHATPKKV
ncbi:hypothetical protein Tco_1292126 [Tanacetum coccineum]